MAHVVQAADGRQLSVQIYGDPDGYPVFLLHGTPGSRLGPHPRAAVLYRLRVCLIAFDRPGYGGSDRLPGRRVADAAADVEAIADHYGIEHFAVVGRSGGGPHALACAALLPDRVASAAALVGLAPRTADGLDWYDGMAESNVLEHMAAATGHDSIAAYLKGPADAIRADPAALIARLRAELPAPDRRVVADRQICDMLTRTYAEAVRISDDGWVDDALAFCSSWGFNLADIAVPVLLWHGSRDRLSPPSHTRWLASRIPDASMDVEPGAAHFRALEKLPDVLPWLADRSGRGLMPAGQPG